MNTSNTASSPTAAKKGKRFLALFLCLCMVMSLMPTFAFAADVDLEYGGGGTATRTAPIIIDSASTASVTEATEGWSWDNDTNTLTLNGLNLQVEDVEFAIDVTVRGTDVVTLNIADGSTNYVSARWSGALMTNIEGVGGINLHGGNTAAAGSGVVISGGGALNIFYGDTLLGEGYNASGINVVTEASASSQMTFEIAHTGSIRIECGAQTGEDAETNGILQHHCLSSSITGAGSIDIGQNTVNNITGPMSFSQSVTFGANAGTINLNGQIAASLGENSIMNGGTVNAVGTVVGLAVF